MVAAGVVKASTGYLGYGWPSESKCIVVYMGFVNPTNYHIDHFLRSVRLNVRYANERKSDSTSFFLGIHHAAV